MSAPGPIALIINPAATRARTTDRSDITRVLAPFGLEWTMTTESSGHATELARRAVAEGARVVVTLGGDGTAAEVAAVLGGGPVAMAALPGGNANVYARATGWPSSLPHALPLLAAGLAGDWRATTTLGHMVLDGGAEHTFLINAGVGIDAATVEWVEARPRLKRRARRAGFALAAVVSAGRAIRAPRLRVSDGRVTVDAVTALVASGSPYTYLGPRPLDLVPGAGHDGRLAWVALTRLRPFELGGLMTKALAGGTPDVGRAPLRGGPLTDELVVTAGRPVPVQADGEPLGHHREVRVRPGDTLTVVDPGGGAGLKSGGPRPT